MSEELVSIIIVNWNAKEFMEGYACSMKQNTIYPKYEVIVVDNGSTDGSAERLKQLQKEGFIDKVIFNKQNKGFAFANNQGFKEAKGEYLFMLNNDTLLTEGWLSNAINALESDERIAAVGSKLIGFHDAFDARKVKAERREKRRLCGAAMVIKKSALSIVGLLDAKNFSPAYAEETDWCYRARNAGFKVVETSNSVVKHFESGSVQKQLPKKEYYELMQTHRLKAILYNLSLPEMLIEVPYLGKTVLAATRRGLLLTLMKSYWNNLTQLPLILQERKRKRNKAAMLKRA